MYRTLLALGAAWLAGCGAGDISTGPADPSGAEVRDLNAIKAAGVLRVATRNAPTTWYVDRFGQPAGLEFDRVSAFAQSLGLSLELVEADSTASVLEAVASGRADLAAAGLTVTPARAERFAFSKPTLQITEQVICNRDGARAKSLDTLSSVSLKVARRSSYADTLTTLAESSTGLAVSTADATTESLLRQVWSKTLDCTVADSHIFALNRRYFPTLIAEFPLTGQRDLAWAMPLQSTRLTKAVNTWLGKAETAALMSATQTRYLAATEEFDFVDMRAFTRRIDERYPKLDRHFQRAGETHNVDPVLLAAQAYQESHWDPKAKSPTGVRGVMMLTQPTAKSLGVTDRLDPRQSINGGSEYLAKMKGRFSDEVKEPDLTYLALAAYNIGRAHMHDAQSLAREMGKSPYEWEDMKTVLPLLSDKSVYPKLKYGYARGHEPVRYVARIQTYSDVLVEHLE